MEKWPLTHVEVDSGTHSCCALAIGKYQIYKLISRHRVARYELVDLIFLNICENVSQIFVHSVTVDVFMELYAVLILRSLT